MSDDWFLQQSLIMSDINWVILYGVIFVQHNQSFVKCVILFLNDINDLMCDIIFLQQSVIMIDIIGVVKNYQWFVKNVWTISIIKSMIIITLFFWQKSRNVWTISFITSVIINDSLKYVFRILDWNIKSLFKPANDNVFCNNSISNMIILLF